MPSRSFRQYVQHTAQTINFHNLKIIQTFFATDTYRFLRQQTVGCPLKIKLDLKMPVILAARYLWFLHRVWYNNRFSQIWLGKVDLAPNLDMLKTSKLLDLRLGNDCTRSKNGILCVDF